MSMHEEGGKPARFERAMMPHLDAVYNLARWLTHNSEDAEEVVQETYLRALRYFDSFTGGDARVWILAITRNTYFTWYRRQNSKLVEFDEQAHGSPPEERTAESALLQKATLTSLRECINALPVEYRETLIMREMEELSYRQIADATSLPVGTVMSRLSRARKRLEQCMTAKGERP